MAAKARTPGANNALNQLAVRFVMLAASRATNEANDTADLIRREDQP